MLSDRIGALDGAAVSAVARHPIGLESDVTLRSRASGAGVYISDRALPAGRWYLRFELRRGPDELRMIETLS